MKQFIYPALYYADDENETSTLLIDDLDIISSSDTVENAYLSAKDHLQNFVDWSIKYGGVINPATSFKETCALNPKRDVLLVDVNSDAVPVDKNSLEEDFQTLRGLLTKSE
ncbi:MAG: hypothetical protein J5689_03245 [Clostridia bacterium]|nr:hypothetical protein [Clostridia bacterium]